jgi:hypothetical protein
MVVMVVGQFLVLVAVLVRAPGMAGLLVLMHMVGLIPMAVGMAVLMQMVVGMGMGVGMAVGLALMLVGVRMHVAVVVIMLVLVLVRLVLVVTVPAMHGPSPVGLAMTKSSAFTPAGEAREHPRQDSNLFKILSNSDPKTIQNKTRHQPR